jgi:uncharacterized protein (DUF1697 family)
VKTFVALLRGINVGGKNKIPMTALKSSFAALGYEDVVTYIQSGNVVFRSSSGAKRTIGSAIERRLAEEFATDVKVVLRTPAELEEAAESNPFLKGKADLSKLHVVFLSSRPPAKAVAELDPKRSPPDEFRVHGREIYLHLPNGFGRSKLTIDYFERRLGVAATARNWKTVMKLLALAQPAD